MITSTVRSRSVLAYDRLDAHYFTSAGVAAYERLAVVDASGDIASVTRVGDFANVWDPPRFARAYAAPEEPGKPYLRPYDAFDYLPSTSSRLSLLRNEDVDRLVPPAGTLLQTCSGRNLGPLTIADDDLAEFALSHDMIRIDVPAEDDRLYLLAFLKTPTGQALLKRGKSGSVIDHITTRDVEALPVPLVADDLRTSIIDETRTAVSASASARLMLRNTVLEQERRLPTPPRNPAHKQGWTLASGQVRDRLDAAFYDPRIRTAIDQIRGCGGTRCKDLAEVFLPVRYKRYYVEQGHGRPLFQVDRCFNRNPSISGTSPTDRSETRPTTRCERE